MSRAADIARAKADIDAVYLAGKASASGSGGGSSAKGVNFYDYDGTLLHSYSVEEAQELTELPELPSHDGLLCQGWNYTLDGIKAQGERVDVGAMYVTVDGKTRLYISIVSDYIKTLPLCFNQTVANGVTVDWGDGCIETFDGAKTLYPTHEYATVGDYVITLAPQDGCTLTLGGASSASSTKPIVGGTSGTYIQAYASMLKKAEIGNNVVIGNYAFRSCFELASVTIPKGVKLIGYASFGNCYSLKSVTVPNSVTLIDESGFSSCYALTLVSIPDSVKRLGNYAFSHCYALTSLHIPDSVTSIGNYAFYYCYSLTSLNIPDGVEYINASLFQNCCSLSSVVIPDSVISILGYAFQYCGALHSVNIPDGVTSIGNYAFENCYSLASVNIPDGVKTIDRSVFSGCYSLTSVSIPDGVTTINKDAFRNCYSLASASMPIISSISASYFGSCSSMTHIDFTKYTSVPTLSSTSYITGINGYCKIRVPAALYDEWIVATNWSAVADRIVAV